MMITVSLLLILCAFAVTIGAALGRAPLWVAVLLITVYHLIGLLPL